MKGNKMKSTCIKDDMFIKLINGTLPPSKEQKVRKHLEACDVCFESYQMGQEFLQEFDPADYDVASSAEAQSYLKKLNVKEPFFKKLYHALKEKCISFLQYLIDMLNHLILFIFPPTPQPAYARIRSRKTKNDSTSETYHEKVIQMASYQTRLIVKPIKNNTYALDIEILNIQKNKLLRCTLKDNSGATSSKPVEEQTVSFEPVSEGMIYELSIHNGGSDSAVLNIEINEKGQINEKKQDINT
jgi:hypothetical protein